MLIRHTSDSARRMTIPALTKWHALLGNGRGDTMTDEYVGCKQNTLISRLQITHSHILYRIACITTSNVLDGYPNMAPFCDGKCEREQFVEFDARTKKKLSSIYSLNLSSPFWIFYWNFKKLYIIFLTKFVTQRWSNRRTLHMFRQ